MANSQSAAKTAPFIACCLFAVCAANTTIAGTFEVTSCSNSHHVLKVAVYNYGGNDEKTDSGKVHTGATESFSCSTDKCKIVFKSNGGGSNLTKQSSASHFWVHVKDNNKLHEEAYDFCDSES